MTPRSCVPLFLQPHGGEAADVRGLSLSLALFLSPSLSLGLHACRLVCGRRGQLCQCVFRPVSGLEKTAGKMATDVFFSPGSTIKETLVAFLMRHVNFIKRGGGGSRMERGGWGLGLEREQARLRIPPNVCL